jgi:hypothetical protein
MVQVQHGHCNQKVKTTTKKYITTTTIHGMPNPFSTFNLSTWKIITISISKIPYQIKELFYSRKINVTIHILPFCMKSFFQILTNFLPYGVKMTTKHN